MSNTLNTNQYKNIVAERDVNIILCNCNSFQIIILESNLYFGTGKVRDDKDKDRCNTGISKYYIMDYPLRYNLEVLPHGNTLEEAQEYCIKHGYSGVTYQNNRYEVRAGKYIQYHNNSDIASWIYI